MAATKMSDAELLNEMLDGEHELPDDTRAAFQGWRDRASAFGRLSLSKKQSEWLHDVAEKSSIQARADNLFTKMPVKEQARQAEKSKGILPWERGADWTPPARK
jgi:hypothetical protein